MNSFEPLLSICIPTYNGASSYLKYVLDTVYRIVEEFDSIEVVICDNCSTDQTYDIIQEYCVNNDKLRHYRNQINQGFNGNMKLLMDCYAKGEYLWMIGDDDIININAIPFILDVLEKGNVEYLSLGFKYITLGDLHNISEIEYTVNYASFATTIDKNCKRGNSFGTFMGSSIVKRRACNSVSKELIENKFDTYYNVWPNAYINATAFCNKECAYIPEDVIYCILHPKEWTKGDNSYKIYTIYSVQMYEYFLTLGMYESELRKTHIRTIYDYIFHSYLRLLSHRKMPNKKFFGMWLNSLRFPIIRKVIYKNFGIIMYGLLTKKSYVLKDVE